jgi:hypothetical protein
MHRLFVFVASVALATGVAVGSAGAQSAGNPIDPGQIFNGFVNGQLKDATIHMACAGPVRPGDLGHPAAGQTVEVERGLDLRPSGFMGNGHQVSADLKLRFPIPHTVHLADFAHYGVKNIPTRILIPCAGDGTVVFRPLNGGSSARAQTVHVFLVGQP